MIELKEESTGAVRTAETNAVGVFRFASLPPGTYTINIKAPGFKGYTQTEIKLASSETRDLGTIKLELGNIVEQITVTAEATPIQTSSAEVSALVDGPQLNTIALKGRDLFGFLALIPGVVDTTSVRDVTSPNAIGGININGGGQRNFTVDGITNLDTGSNGTIHYEPNIDSIAEVRVLTSNYQAEYGRNSSGLISVITKGGGRDFRGSAFWNKRHEQFNANDFFRNRSNLSKAPYRYDVFGYGIGGPVFIPKRFNTDRSRLFFFVSQEFTRRMEDQGTRYTNMPTALEREGDFSQSLNTAGTLIQIKDPQTGLQFPGNKILANRFNKVGQAMLKFFPLPNYTEADPTLKYARNYVASGSGPHPRRNDVIRIDVTPITKLNGFFRYVNDADDLNALFQSGATWTDYIEQQSMPGHGYAVGATYTISSKMVNEFLFGKSFNTVIWSVQDPSTVSRDKMGNPPHWYTSLPSDPEARFWAEYVPSVSFGSIPTSTGFSNLSLKPYTNYNNIWSVSDNLSCMVGKHTLKTGLYFERTGKLQQGGSLYLGYFNFASDPYNPLNTGNGYANALLGNFYSYSEGQKILGDFWFTTLEYYVQDSWKATKRLTVDAGVRFYMLFPQGNLNNNSATFVPGLYDKTKSARLYYPALSAGKRVAKDLVTGTIAPVPMIGLFVPGTGSTANGMEVCGKSNVVPQACFSNPSFQPAPRLGLAIDVFGDGKTALRMGVGMFYNRMDGNQIMPMTGNVPTTYTPTLYYSNIDTVTLAAGTVGPSSSSFIMGTQPLESMVNMSFGIQQSLGFSTVVDASYVGAFRRHIPQTRDINPIAMFARFDPANVDPANPNTVLADNFFRPKAGHSALTSRDFMGTSNYHSLQMLVRRRWSKSLSFGAAYTFSKVLGMTGYSVYADMNPLFATRTRNFGLLSNDRTHVLVINYTYDLPKLGQKLKNKFIGAVVDNWTISGITTFSSGAPYTPSYSLSPSKDITGSAEAARMNLVADPNLPTNQRTFGQQFNTAAFALPAACSWANQTTACFGNAGVNYLRGPGINNWDMTFAKAIPLGLGEGRSLRFRGEFYNIWNHTQFSSVNSSAIFNPNTGAQTNANFGAFSAARAPRQISLSLRLQF